uniref:Uncharacterized protein n=1 Tax=Panagrolaimus davidi TaxID=227884 RepID=A0A914PHG7_9BILA
MEIMKLQLVLKESLSKCHELDEIISKEKDENEEDEEGKIAAKIKEIEEEDLEYQRFIRINNFPIFFSAVKN